MYLRPSISMDADGERIGIYLQRASDACTRLRTRSSKRQHTHNSEQKAALEFNRASLKVARMSHAMLPSTHKSKGALYYFETAH